MIPVKLGKKNIEESCGRKKLAGGDEGDEIERNQREKEMKGGSGVRNAFRIGNCESICLFFPVFVLFFAAETAIRFRRNALILRHFLSPCRRCESTLNWLLIKVTKKGMLVER